MADEQSSVEAGWYWVLNIEDDRHVIAIAARAASEPVLRALYPYPNESNLRFSIKCDYPYDAGLPYVLTTPHGEYEARDEDNAPLARGTIDEVVAAVAKCMGRVLEARAK